MKLQICEFSQMSNLCFQMQLVSHVESSFKVSDWMFLSKMHLGMFTL